MFRNFYLIIYFKDGEKEHCYGFDFLERLLHYVDDISRIHLVHDNGSSESYDMPHDLEKFRKDMNL